MVVRRQVMGLRVVRGEERVDRISEGGNGK